MRYQLRLLLLSVAAVVLIVIGTFFTNWFVIHAAGGDVLIDLRHVRHCSPQCASSGVGELSGMFPGAAALAFWTSLPLFVVIATQAGSRLLAGYAYSTLGKIGTGLGAIAFFSAFAAGFLSPPDGTAFAGFELMIVERQWGPFFLVLGALAGLATIRYASIDPSDGPAPYQPVIIPKLGDSKDGATRLPVTPISTNKLPTPVGGELRAKSSTTPPVTNARVKSPTAPPDARVKSPTSPPVERAKPITGSQPAVARTASTTAPHEPRPKHPSDRLPAIARTASPTNPPVIVIPPASGPIDVSARLGAAPIEVAIRPPLPLPAPPPDDQIPVAPESGLVIRKRPPSVAPEPTELPLPPDIGLAIRTKAPSAAPPMMASVASALGVAPPASMTAPTPVPEPPGRPTPVPGLVKYAVTKAELTSAGIQATREDGFAKLIKWENIVGIVARRLPQAAPYDGRSFVDIVSSKGSTMRILPSTEIIGHTIDRDHPDETERARALVNVLAAQALDAKLDTATKVFATGTSKAPQLKNPGTLATHDERLA